jgi:hypothetical protein
MVSVDDEAIECVKMETDGMRNYEILRDKDSLLQISSMRLQPILKCGKKYVVLDGAATAFVYEEK